MHLVKTCEPEGRAFIWSCLTNIVTEGNDRQLANIRLEKDNGQNVSNVDYVRICLARPIHAMTINPRENGTKNSGRPFPWEPM